MDRHVVGNISFGPNKFVPFNPENKFIPFKPPVSPTYQDLLNQLVERAKKENIDLADTLEAIEKKWKGWDN